MVDFIDDHGKVHGVEPICRVLPIAPSTYYDAKAQQADPARRSARTTNADPRQTALMTISIKVSMGRDCRRV